MPDLAPFFVAGQFSFRMPGVLVASVFGFSWLWGWLGLRGVQRWHQAFLLLAGDDAILLQPSLREVGPVLLAAVPALRENGMIVLFIFCILLMLLP